jgi:hypothetical protein
VGIIRVMVHYTTDTFIISADKLQQIRHGAPLSFHQQSTLGGDNSTLGGDKTSTGTVIHYCAWGTPSALQDKIIIQKKCFRPDDS